MISLRRILLLLIVGMTLHAQTSPDPYATLVTIEKHGRIKLRLDGHTRLISSNDLTTILTRAGNPEGRTVFIKADPSIAFGTVQETLDHIHSASITKVEVVSPSNKR